MVYEEDLSVDKGPQIYDYPVLQDYVDVFQELPNLPPKTTIEFTIELIPRTIPTKKAPYRMSTPHLEYF
jgi:hypothetical protein